MGGEAAGVTVFGFVTSSGDLVDLLIATAATLDDAPLVTRNVEDFARVPGLRLIDY
jgi:predicted nucleic acid-binding protein